MKSSLRRISNTLLALSVVGLFINIISSIGIHCGIGGDGCLAAVFSNSVFYSDLTQSNVSISSAMTTASYQENGGFSFEEFNAVLQLTSIYALFVAVVILIALEFFELYYIRRFLSGVRKFKLR